MLFSEPKIPQSHTSTASSTTDTVSVLFSEPKIPQFIKANAPTKTVVVSVLFSEPKIPQCVTRVFVLEIVERFSALQRAENSSMLLRAPVPLLARVFQCSSASRKFLNMSHEKLSSFTINGFSALQRAENSSIFDFCARDGETPGFSALQRAENSSIV